jgi:diamine N-acetyltransferase
MYAIDPDDDNYWIYRFMIAEQFQGRGYGFAALKALVERMQALPGCSSIILGVEPANEDAAKLYRRAGFRERGDQIDGETIMVRQL